MTYCVTVLDGQQRDTAIQRIQTQRIAADVHKLIILHLLPRSLRSTSVTWGPWCSAHWRTCPGRRP